MRICIFVYIRIPLLVGRLPESRYGQLKYTYTHLRIQLFIHICIYVYMYIFIYVYICIYIYSLLLVGRLPKSMQS